MTTITIIGGGLAGLTAAIASAERGAAVVLHEAHSHLGGRARSTDGPYIANDGAHAFYADGAPWRWLKERGLVQPFHALKPSTLARMRFRHEDRLRRLPPMPFNRMVTLGRRHRAPVEVSYRDWATGRFGPAAYRASLGFLRPVTFFHDPGSLSAAFCQERLHRVVAMGYPATRYPRGGWGAMIANMRRRAVGLGVRIETGSRVTALPEDGPVIVATSLEAARDLLGDPSLRWESGRVACRDLALPSGRDDTPLLFDLDEGALLERFSETDPSLAPSGRSLVQGYMPARPDESKADALRRLDRVYDQALPGWRTRLVWSRDQLAHHRTGALDLPGRTWRDRPAIDQGDGRYLAGDMVAAPGILAEVSITSALKAATQATHHPRRPSPQLQP
ncbi:MULTISPECIES: NAD(P)-binding protein [Actinomadura]|uniref:NAD(P)-binding protein n=1 Tax=Actinomadura yumaensis TaxID=111807 RepID=A0ABW2CE95_9ACTN|nr:NAD(P)-binding protein [Actinomadura sp. J1-007]MWK38252.1 NAD(P)-binding protein [Actinomadura sp. J1-007]